MRRRLSHVTYELAVTTGHVTYGLAVTTGRNCRRLTERPLGRRDFLEAEGGEA